MKRPDIDTIFGPVDISVKEIANRILNLFLNQFEAYLSRYYANVKYDPERGSFRFSNEEMNLNGREDLLERLERAYGGMWSMDINMDFAAAETYLAVFSDQRNKLKSTLVLSMEGELTQFLEEEEAPQIPFVLFLIQVAKSIGSKWFFSGLRLVDWNFVPISQIMDRTQLGSCPYIVCWEEGILDQQELLHGFGLDAGDVKLSTMGYKFVTFFPKV